MTSRTFIATLALAAAVAPAARAQESLVADRMAAAMLEVARVTQSAQADAERALALSQAAQEKAAEQQEKAKAVQEKALALYNEGKIALDRGQWDRAREIFVRLRAEKSDRTDAAQYWLAYAQYKLGQAAEALASLRELEASFPESRWRKDAQALEMELRGSSRSAAESTSNEELKLLALSSLIESNSDQAIAILEKVLSGNQSPQVKKRALFILSQSKSPKAKEILAAAAKGSANPDLQMEALQYLGLFGGPDNFKLLGEIYAASSDRNTKKKILEAYMVSGQKDALLKAAKTEADSQLRKSAVTMLGAGHATSELWELYQQEKDTTVRRAALEGLFIAGDVDRLIEVAKTEKDAELRAKALQFMGLRHDARATAFLLETYWQQGQTADIKRRVIDGLFIQHNATALIDIAKKETDASMKKEVVSRLSVMKSKEATAYLLELINK